MLHEAHKGTKAREDSRTMLLYLKEIAKIPLLTAEEEKQLGYRSRAGDLDARQRLTECNLRFVIKIAKKFSKRPGQLMDLINVGNLGLIEAARRFDPDRNVRFTSYAIWWIRQAIFHYLTESNYAFRISPKLANTLYRTARVLNSRIDPEQSLDREQLAKEVHASVEEVTSALKLMSGTLSLDQPITEEQDLLLQDRLEQKVMPSPEQAAIFQHIRSQLDQSIRRLTPMEQSVISLRFGLNDYSPMTLREIGKRMDLSRERIRQIEDAALKKLHEMQAARALQAYLT